MNISHKKSSKKYYIAAALIVLVVICSATFYWYLNTPSSTNTPTSSESTTDEDASADGTEENTLQEQPPDNTGTDPSSNDNTGVSTPATNPSIDDQYPVTNEHYQIKQIDDSKYQITLYPVINNPEYSDYNAQLKSYKQEALDYLNKRYGSTAGFNIEWTPEDAANL